MNANANAPQSEINAATPAEPWGPPANRARGLAVTNTVTAQDSKSVAIDPRGEVTMKGCAVLTNPVYTEKELDGIQVVGRAPETFGDKVAHSVVKRMRRAFDIFSGYKDVHITEDVLKQNPVPIEQLRQSGQLLSPKGWLFRFILLESFAGVPGMVAGTLRHLRSLRLLRKDGGWINTLLEEAENERMHLLTFMSIAQPTIATRLLVITIQGVAYNVFFLVYMFFPNFAHRFVGALEEEAVRTYSHCIQDIERGLIPEWNDFPAPRFAIDYWRMHDSATLLDVIKSIRADEATHRFVNHSLANLDQHRDYNPFALSDASPEVRGTKACFTREESARFAQQNERALIAGEAS